MQEAYENLKPGDYWQFPSNDNETYVVTDSTGHLSGVFQSRIVEESNTPAEIGDFIVLPNWCSVIQVDAPSPIEVYDTVRFVKPLTQCAYGISGGMRRVSDAGSYMEVRRVSNSMCSLDNGFVVEPENLVRINDKEPEHKIDDMITLNLTREHAYALFTVTGEITGSFNNSPRQLTEEIYEMLESKGFSENDDDVKQMRRLINCNANFDDWPKKVDPWEEAKCRAGDLKPGDLFILDGKRCIVTSKEIDFGYMFLFIEDNTLGVYYPDTLVMPVAH